MSEAKDEFDAEQATAGARMLFSQTDEVILKYLEDNVAGIRLPQDINARKAFDVLCKLAFDYVHRVIKPKRSLYDWIYWSPKKSEQLVVDAIKDILVEHPDLSDEVQLFYAGDEAIFAEFIAERKADTCEEALILACQTSKKARRIIAGQEASEAVQISIVDHGDYFCIGRLIDNAPTLHEATQTAIASLGQVPKPKGREAMGEGGNQFHSTTTEHLYWSVVRALIKREHGKMSQATEDVIMAIGLESKDIRMHILEDLASATQNAQTLISLLDTKVAHIVSDRIDNPESKSALDEETRSKVKNAMQGDIDGFTEMLTPQEMVRN